MSGKLGDAVAVSLGCGLLFRGDLLCLAIKAHAVSDARRLDPVVAWKHMCKNYVHIRMQSILVLFRTFRLAACGNGHA